MSVLSMECWYKLIAPFDKLRGQVLITKPKRIVMTL